MKISVVIACYNKKIAWKDGIRAIYAIIEYNFFTAPPRAIAANTGAVVSSVSEAPLPAAVKAC